MNIKLTGIAAELLKAKEISFDNPDTVGQIKKEIITREPRFNNFEILISVDSYIPGDDVKLKGDEDIVVFNPYAGG